MIWSPDLRITAEQPRLPMLLSSTVAGDPATSHDWPKPAVHAPGHRTAAPLPTYSGGTVWALHPLPMIIRKRRITG